MLRLWKPKPADRVRGTMSGLREEKLREYDESYPNYVKIENIVAELLEKTLKEGGIRPMQIAHRIKSRDSVAGKMERKPEKYPRVGIMNDLIGFRLICYFSYQVDEMAKLVEKVLVVDREKSSDKRKQMAPTAFGYLSLHYICSLPKNAGYPDELTVYTFEIQFRTVLQHAWAEIEHDLGYKTEFGIPLDVRREFSRVAGLLEIADETFESIKNKIGFYEEVVRKAIANDEADELTLDLITLTEYMLRSRTMGNLLTALNAITGAEIIAVSPENYLERLQFFGIRKLGDLNSFVEQEQEHALMLAQSALVDADLDEIASTAGLHYLCRAKLVFGGYREEEMRDYFSIYISDENKITKQIRSIFHLRERYGKDFGENDENIG